MYDSAEELKQLMMLEAITLRVLVQGRRFAGVVLKCLQTFSRAQRERITLEYDLTQERASVMNSVRG